MTTTLPPSTASRTVTGDDPLASGPIVAASRHSATDDTGPQSGGHGEDDIGPMPETPRVAFPWLMLIGLALAGVLAALFMTGYLPRLEREKMLQAHAEEAAKSLPRVRVMHPVQSPANTVALLPGDVQAMGETTIYPRTSGYLREWLVDIGDEVKEGQLLAIIDTPEVDQQLREAEATLGQYRAKLLTAEATRDLAVTNLQRYVSLPKGVVTKQELDERQAMVDTAESTVKAAEADVAAGAAKVQQITELQAFSRVYAPFAGTITARTVDIGQLLTTGNGAAQSLFRLAKTDPVRVFVNVPQIYAPGVAIGQTAELVIRELPNRKFVGEIKRTARAIDPTTRTLLTEIHVPNPDHALLTGSYVNVKLDVTRTNPPLLIPATALVFNSDGTKVAVVGEEDKIILKSVTVDGDYGRDIGISSGLSATDIAVINPGDRLDNGMKVAVDNREDLSKAAANTPMASAAKSAK